MESSTNSLEVGAVSGGFTLHCPFDGVSMDKVHAGGVTVDRCVKCKSIWLDMNELPRVLAVKKLAEQLDITAEAKSAPKPKIVECPRDHSRLIQMVHPKQGQVKYLSCKTCGGALLHAGDLHDLAKYTLLERVKRFFSLR
jgi:Zn-finger nucleic acid-binding protein